ncbi:hypothetical protein BO86DRAFT_53331 [Aspergillus japonicus CBS 114.51]|uniref:SnoaL-like domain-containing protein n=2 Tax=Aspergillus TaxID=5052 RepID=A0A2V5HK28_ASPV1|nr:hypothetical protein BO86DRAFT_53331 [Aspergillus japonicus CBS 114.51]PYI21793.1 hypothetical protein BO99DRAFT_51063 [Aspergillus violaceofuscus CBS 115571]RAH83150.1 hypothetical protein BO86DRAFT_53331 [Aspergillus japonicus CBS 114.51]
MHFQSLTTTLLLPLLLLTSTHATPTTPSTNPDEFTQLNCPNTTTPTATPAEQLAAWTEFTKLMYTEHRLSEALTHYVAGQYINHSPLVAGTGVGATAAELTNLVPDVTSQLQRAFVGWDAAGNAFGVAHTRVIPNSQGDDTKGGESALVDIIRMVGTCMVEHWDVEQEVGSAGAGGNPIAFF